MGITVSGIVNTEVMLAELGMTARRRVTSKLHQKALEIQKLARQMAPVDDMNLEKAIKVFPESNPSVRVRDALGRFTRVDIYVYVDMEMEVPGRPGKKVGDYAYLMHEHLAPFGSYNLGEKSKAKQSGQDVMVGGKYLERAYAQLGQQVVDEVSQDLLTNLGFTY